MLLETLLPKAVLKDLRGEDTSVLGAAQMRPTGRRVCARAWGLCVRTRGHKGRNTNRLCMHADLHISIGSCRPC